MDTQLWLLSPPLPKVSNQQPPKQPSTQMASRFGEAIWLVKLLESVVPGGGIEPPWSCLRRILSPLRLPVPPSRRYPSLPHPAVTANFRLP
jgi:hypothetical protein